MKQLSILSFYSTLIFIFGLFFFWGFFVQAQAVNVRPNWRKVEPRFVSINSGILLDVGVYYGQSEATATPGANNEFKNNSTVYDLKLGYVTDSNFYWGGEHSTRTDENSVETVTGQGSGLGLGYFGENGFNLRAFYRFHEHYAEFRQGSGYHVELGYRVRLLSNLFLGLAISHRELTYKQNTRIANSDQWMQKTTNPVLTLGLLLN